MTELQLKVIEELEKYYGWSDIVDDSSLSIELLKDTVNATAQVVKNLTIPDVMPRISHFIDENGSNVDLNAAGVNAKLLRDGTFEYFRSYGFAGRKQLTPVYGA
jgi:hypothetical protein